MYNKDPKPYRTLQHRAISREFGKSVDWLLTGEEKKQRWTRGSGKLRGMRHCRRLAAWYLTESPSQFAEFVADGKLSAAAFLV